MKNLLDRFTAMQERGGQSFVLSLAALGALSVLLLVAAVIGAFAVGDDENQVSATGTTAGDVTDSTDATSPDAVTDGTTTDTAVDGAVPAEGAAPGTEGAVTGTPGAPGVGGAPRPGSSSTGPVAEAPPAPGEQPLPKGGNATGVTGSEIKYGVHAPITFNKAPVPLAGPVVRGIRTYVDFVNQQGGINGRKIKLEVADDEFTTGGANSAGNELINDRKVFFIAGTLGVDQIQVVANAAKKAGVPYFAGGGHEPQFKDFGVYQILSSYDTHVVKLAQWMATDDRYKGKKVGVIVSDTPLIHPVVTDLFKKALADNGLELVAAEKVQKPEFQSAQGYGGITLNFKGKGVQVVVPLTDPINTAGLVRQCRTEGGCPWTYSFSNFAHDGETALTLFNDEWGQQKVRGLSGGCYPNGPDDQLNNVGKCGSMGKAKAQFEAIKGRGSWTATQNDQDGASVGYNSAAGYQWIGFWLKAMKDMGSEVTRERLLAAVRRYENYGDLITGPITYKNSSNVAHGAEKMTVWEAQTSNKYKMISDGFLDRF